jgi:hypothetical protein
MALVLAHCTAVMIAFGLGYYLAWSRYRKKEGRLIPLDH